MNPDGTDIDAITSTLIFDNEPKVMSDGRLMFTARATKDNTGVFIQSAGANKILLLSSQTNAAYAAVESQGGFLLFVKEDTLFAQQIGRAHV